MSTETPHGELDGKRVLSRLTLAAQCEGREGDHDRRPAG